jgi:hypothetical protein
VADGNVIAEYPVNAPAENTGDSAIAAEFWSVIANAVMAGFMTCTMYDPSEECETSRIFVPGTRAKLVLFTNSTPEVNESKVFVPVRAKAFPNANDALIFKDVAVESVVAEYPVNVPEINSGDNVNIFSF